MPKLVGYVRVPKFDEDQLKQVQWSALTSAGVSDRYIFEDVVSRRKDDQPGLKRCLKILDPGDTLLLWRLDRAGRDLRHLVNFVNQLLERGVGLKVLSGAGASIDTTADGDGQILSVFCGLAEFERELISEGQRSGGAMASKIRGHRGGRTPKMTLAKIELARAAMAQPETNVGALCARLGIARQTLYRFVGPSGELREDGLRLMQASGVNDTGGLPA